MEQVKYSYVPTIELDKIKQGMAQVEKILNNKNLATDQTQRFTELFTKLKEEAKKYTAILQSGFSKDSDLSALEKSGKTLKTIMTNISTEFSDIDFSELEKTFSSSSQKAKELRETIADIKNQLRDVGGQDLKNRVIGSTTKMKKVSSSSAVGKFEAGFNSGDYSMMEEAYESLTKNAKTFKNPEKIKVVNESLKEMKSILDQLKNDPAFQDLAKELQRVQQELDETNKSDLKEYEKQLTAAGVDVKKLIELLDQLRQKNKETAESQKDLTDEFEHFKDQAKYLFSIGSAIQIIKKAVTDAFQSVKELDAAMTQTAVVSEYTVDQMWKTLPEKTAQANKFGASIKGVYEVETLYYQQGLKANEVTAVGAETLKMAKISGLDYAAATDAMTAALRGFNMEVNAMNSQKVNDVYSALAAYTASDVEELSTAMTKTASISASAGMEFANTSAFLAKIIETTRESAETAGTAMKTIVARFTEIKNDPNAVLDNEDGTTVTLNKIQSALASVGVSLTDEENQIRNLDSVFMDLARKWDTLDTNTQRYIATISAGSRQQSRFIAMMSDYERTMELVEIANDSAGASQKQFDKTTESLEFRLTQLSNAWDQFTQNLANNKAIKIAVSALTSILTAINHLVTAGGLIEGSAASFLLTLTLIINTFSIIKNQINKEGKGIFALLKKLINPKEIADGVKKGIEQAGVEVKPTVEKMGQDFEAAGKKMGEGIVSGVKTAMPQVQNAINNINDTPGTANISSNITEKLNVDQGIIKKTEENKTVESVEDIKESAKEIPKAIKDSQVKTGLDFKKLGSSIKSFGSDLWTDVKAQYSSPLSKITLIIGVITTVAGFMQKVIDDNTITIEERLEKVSSALDSIKAKVDETIENIEGIDDLKNSVNDYEANLSILNKGTKDYIKSQRQLNSIVRKIIQEEPEMTQYTKFENGRYVIDDKFWTEYENRLENTLERQSNIENTLTASQSSLSYQSYREKMINTELVSEDEEQKMLSGAHIGGLVLGGIAALAATIITGGLAAPLIAGAVATAIGAGAGSIIGGAGKQYNSKQVDLITKTLSDIYGTITDADLNRLAEGNLSNEDQKLLSIFGNDEAALKEYFTALKGNAEAVNNSIKAVEANTNAILGIKDSEGNSLISDGYTEEAYEADVKQAGLLFNDYFNNKNNWNNILVGTNKEDGTGGKSINSYIDEVAKNEGFSNINGQWMKEGQVFDPSYYKEQISALYAYDYANYQKKYFEKISEQDQVKLGDKYSFALGREEERLKFEAEYDTSEWTRLVETGIIPEKEAAAASDDQKRIFTNFIYGLFPKQGSEEEDKEYDSLRKQLYEMLSQAITGEMSYDSAYYTGISILQGLSTTEAFGENDSIGKTLFNNGKIKSIQSALKLNRLFDNKLFNKDSITKLMNAVGGDAFNEILNKANLETEEGIRNFVNSLESNGINIEDFFKKTEEEVVKDFLKITKASEDAAGKLKNLGNNAELISEILKGNKKEFTEEEKTSLETINPSLKGEFINVGGKYYYSGSQPLADAIQIPSSINAASKTPDEIQDILNSLINLKDFKSIYNSSVFSRNQKLDSLRGLARMYGATEDQISGATSINDLYNLVGKLAENVAKIEEAQVKNELEKRVYDAIIKNSKDDIEAKKTLNDSLKETEDKIISNMEKSLNLQRQTLNNQRTQNEIDKKKNALATLIASGGSASEIKKLQDEITRTEEDQNFDLIDQNIQALKSKNEEAQTQRDKMIELLQSQLDSDIKSGEIWNEVNNYLKEIKDGKIDEDSSLFKILARAEDYSLLSENGKILFKNSLNDMAKTFATTLGNILKGTKIYIPKGEGKGSSSPFFSEISFYATGGLNTTTGPAWLDGTPSKPELVLNAQDTKNFLKLRDILRNNFNANSTQKGGDSYFNVNISVDSISSDYDVHKIAQQVKKEITAESRFRNVVTVK